MSLSRLSPCKVNFLLNILGKRPAGFHELETLLHPVGLFDRLEFQRGGVGIDLSCDHPSLPADGTNLVCRAAAVFLEAAGISDGVRIRLEKHIPLEAGLGGGSGNAATTLVALNELFGQPLPPPELGELAARLGSDVPFFLQSNPALGTARGDLIQPLPPFPMLREMRILLVHPGFGVPTAWAYHQLANFPAALNGRPGRAARLIEALRAGRVQEAAREFYNALETPVFTKYPLLQMFGEFLRRHGAIAALMSGSGSSTFALTSGEAEALQLQSAFKAEFGDSCWTAVAPF